MVHRLDGSDPLVQFAYMNGNGVVLDPWRARGLRGGKGNEGQIENAVRTYKILKTKADYEKDSNQEMSNLRLRAKMRMRVHQGADGIT